MTLKLGCIADDYTGASDLANTLQKNGLATVQTIGIPAPSLAGAIAGAEAMVVSLKIRSVPAADAVAQARAAEAFLRASGATHIMYKVCSTFDSTDDGNIGPMLDAFGAQGQVALVTPAFPETGRTVYMGNLFVNGVPLNESPLKDHPLNPMHDANLTRVMQRQSRAKVGLASWDVVKQGPNRLREHLASLAAQGISGAIADAIDEEDLVTLGRVAADTPFSIGASGLGLGLARVLGGKLRNGVESGVGGKGAALSACIAGSCSAQTLKQIAAAEKIMPVLRLDSEALVENGAAEVARGLAFAREHLSKGPLLIASSQLPEQVQAVQARFGRDAAGHAIEQGMASLAEGLLALGVKHLVVAGGETSGAAVDRLGIEAFRLGPEIAAGVPMLEAIGARQAGLLMALKSGNFGGEAFFADALAMMRG